MHFSGIVLKKKKESWKETEAKVFNKFSQESVDQMIDMVTEEKSIDLDALAEKDFDAYQLKVKEIKDLIKTKTGSECIFDYFSLDGFLNGEENPDKEFTLKEARGTAMGLLNNKDLLDELQVIVTPDLEVLSLENIIGDINFNRLNKLKDNPKLDKNQLIEESELEISKAIKEFRNEVKEILENIENDVEVVGIDLHI